MFPALYFSGSRELVFILPAALACFLAQPCWCESFSCIAGRKRQILCSTSHPLFIKRDNFQNTWSFISLYLFSFQIVDVKILKKKDNGLEVSILEDEDNVVAWIPTLHLSDFVATSKLLWHCLQEGDVLPRVMYLSDKGEHIVSFAASTRQTKCEEGGVSQDSRVPATNIRLL